MILDMLLEFADDVSVAGAAGTWLIGSQIDLGATGLDIGNGEPIYCGIFTGSEEIITGGSAGTIRFQMVSDAAAAIATDGSASVHFDTGTLVTDDAAANDARLNVGGRIAFFALPQGTYERHLGLLAIIATTTVTAGKVKAFLTKDPNGWKAYANADGAAIGA